MSSANTCHAIFIFNNFLYSTMSNDIKIFVDYIPEDLQVCAKCIFFEVCPYDYTCETFNRVQEYERMIDEEKTKGDL